jgi:hypothetical protein
MDDKNSTQQTFNTSSTLLEGDAVNNGTITVGGDVRTEINTHTKSTTQNFPSASTIYISMLGREGENISHPLDENSIQALLVTLQEQLKLYYQSEKHRIFERLFAGNLDVKNSYINLTIVHDEVQREMEQSLRNESSNTGKTLPQYKSNDLRTRRLANYEDIHNSNQAILPNELFMLEHYSRHHHEKEETLSLESNKLEHLLVLGKAGIGKSTLMRKLAYSWAAETWWKEGGKNRFDWVFHISLRQVVKNFTEGANPRLDEIIYHQCASWLKITQTDWQLLWETMQQSANVDKVLLLLDGYDEVSREHPAIKTLLGAKHYIISSRPYNIYNIQVDAKLELTGFTYENVKLYVNSYYAHDHEQGRSLQRFIDNNLNIRGITHIPINVELLCGVWGDLKRDNKLVINATVSELYKQIVVKLFKNYIIHQKNVLDKTTLEKRGLAHNIDGLDAEDVFKCCYLEINYLSLLALNGIQKEQLILDKGLLSKTKNELKLDPGIFREHILPAGFLRSIKDEKETSRDELSKDYYFIHLTFQEYFVAHQLAQWLQGNVTENNRAQEIIQKNKFDFRYQMVWMFLAGELADATTNEQSSILFNHLLDESLPIQEVYSLCVLVRCLDEALGKMNNIPAQEKILDLLKNKIKLWSSGDDSSFSDEAILLNHLSMSPRILTILALEDQLLGVIAQKKRERSSGQALLLLTSLFPHSTKIGQSILEYLQIYGLQHYALAALGHLDYVPDVVLNWLLERLRANAPGASLSVIDRPYDELNFLKDVLSNISPVLQTDDTKICLQVLMGYLKGNSYQRVFLLQTLVNLIKPYQKLVDEVLSYWDAYLLSTTKSEEQNGDWNALIMRLLKYVPSQTRPFLLERCAHDNEDVRWAAINVLLQMNESVANAKDVLLTFIDSEKYWYGAFNWLLQLVSDDDLLKLDVINSRLIDKNTTFVYKVYLLLNERLYVNKLPILYQKILFILIYHPIASVRDQIFLQIEKRFASFNIVQQEELFTAIRKNLTAGDPAIRDRAIQLLAQHQRLDEAAFTAIRENLTARDAETRDWAVQLLAQHQRLDEAAFTALRENLTARDPAKRDWAVQLLAQHQRLDEATFPAINKNLTVGDPAIRHRTKMLMEKHFNDISPHILILVTDCQGNFNRVIIIIRNIYDNISNNNQAKLANILISYLGSKEIRLNTKFCIHVFLYLTKNNVKLTNNTFEVVINKLLIDPLLSSNERTELIDNS